MNLYSGTNGPFSINSVQPWTSDLGQIVYAGTKWNSRATYAHAEPPHYVRPTPHYLLVFTLEGEADYRDDTGVRTVMNKGSMVWTAPGVNQSYGPKADSRWSELFMWFGGKAFDLWHNSGYPGKQSRHLHLEPFDYWLGRLRKLITPPPEAHDAPLTRVCQLQQFLADALQTQTEGHASLDNKTWCDSACRKLSEGKLTDPSLETVARSFNMSYSLFRKRFLILTGESPGAFRTDELIRQASLRIVKTNDTIAEIAEFFGFHDQFHFSRRFKQIIGMTPTDFRRQAKITG